jgi:hypothetical protein
MIKAFRVNHIYTCELTGKCLVEVQFKGTNSPMERLVSREFENVDKGKLYINSEARSWFLFALENYIGHKKHIINSSTDNATQKSSLLICENALAHYENWPLQKICTKFIGGFSHFLGILPYPHNESYQSSQNDLKELKLFCEEYLKTNPAPKQ